MKILWMILFVYIINGAAVLFVSNLLNYMFGKWSKRDYIVVFLLNPLMTIIIVKSFFDLIDGPIKKTCNFIKDVWIIHQISKRES